MKNTYSILDCQTDVIYRELIMKLHRTCLLDVVHNTTLEGTDLFIFITAHKEGVIEVLDTNIDASIEGSFFLRVWS